MRTFRLISTIIAFGAFGYACWQDGHRRGREQMLKDLRAKDK